MSSPNHSPFALLTQRLIILPTPSAVKVKEYRSMYSRLHTLPEFCTMAFGPDFPLKSRDDAEAEEWIGVEVNRNWNGRGLGDCAVGVWTRESGLGKQLSDGDVEARLVEGPEFEQLGRLFDEVQWVGYVGVRDCISRLPQREPGDPALPPWDEMIEIRYGYAPEAWGKGYGTEAAKALMLWAVKEKGVRRFIAETEKLNLGSGKILGKLGFQQRNGIEIWKEPAAIEWEKFA
jgi:GNAT superfamily N-acetyltransferase